MSIVARYDSAAVDRVDVTVLGPSGETVASERITEYRGRVTADIEAPRPGTSTVTATASNVEAGTRTTTVRVSGTTPTPPRHRSQSFERARSNR